MSTVTFIVASVLNSLWQSAIVAGAVWTVLRLFQTRLNAATRYVIWWIALLAVLTLPWVHLASPTSGRPQPSAAPALQHALPAQVAAPFAKPVPDVLVTVTSPRTAQWPLWVFTMWSLVFAWHIYRMTRSYFFLRRVKGRATSQAFPLPDVRRKLRLLLSTEIDSPMAAGFLAPAVLIPDHLREQLTPQEFRCVVLHECAHLARHDDWANIIGRSVGALGTLHPVVWWILREIEREREEACDDWVVARTGAADPYAEALTRIAELRISARNTVLASGIFSSRSRLRTRVEMLLRHGRVFSPAAARQAISFAVLALACLLTFGALAPHWIAFAQRPEFEVASIRENRINGGTDFRPRRSGQLFMMHNTRIFALENYAYDLTARYQVVGEERFPVSWKWYDIDARIPNGATEEQVKLMVQSLLEDRFKFRTHRENREVTQFAVVVDKGKSKLSPATDHPMDLTIEGRRLLQEDGSCGVSLWKDGARWTCHAASIDKIVKTVGQMLQAPVVDRTGLNGSYDVNVRYIPDDRKADPNAPFGPTFEQVLQEELGLRLEKGKGKIEVLVIDHMEEPSEN